MTRPALVCDCCKVPIVVLIVATVQEARLAAKNARGSRGSTYIRGKDMCGTCWGRGCEVGKKHLRRSA